jgi:hypothetical protein
VGEGVLLRVGSGHELKAAYKDAEAHNIDYFENLFFQQTMTVRPSTLRGIKPGMRAVEKGDWKLIKYDTLDGTVRKTQLYNLKANPNEFLKEHQKKGKNGNQFS